MAVRRVQSSYEVAMKDLLVMSKELYCAYRDRNLQAITQLIENGESVNVYDYHTNTPFLSLAIQSRWTELACFLIQHGADVNAQSIDDGYTPLMRAAQMAEYDLVTELIKHGADLDIKTRKGFTVFFYAHHEDEFLQNLLRT
jgi:ankyrin repeat protein